MLVHKKDVGPDINNLPGFIKHKAIQCQQIVGKNSKYQGTIKCDIHIAKFKLPMSLSREGIAALRAKKYTVKVTGSFGLNKLNDLNAAMSSTTAISRTPTSFI